MSRSLPTRALAAAALTTSLVGVYAPAVAAAPVTPLQVTVYDSIGAAVPPNVASVGFEATSTDELGDIVQLGAGPRRLDSVTVLMSSWACETGNWTSGCVTTPGASFTHPITLNLYAVDDSGPTPAIGSLLQTQTTTFTIPYRPTADATCPSATQWRASNGQCYNGFAHPITFTFPTNPVVPSRVAWTVTYNTNTSGPAPLGVSGPYDSLNVGVLAPTPTAGTNLDPAGLVLKSNFASYNCGLTPLDVLRNATPCWSANQPMARINTIAASQDDATVVVKAIDTSWVFFPESTVGGQSGAYVTGPATAPLGAGSASLSLTASNQGMALGTLLYAGTPLRNLTTLDYSVHQSGATVQAAALQFDVNYTGAAGFQGRLVYEPVYNGTVSAGWQRWRTLDGKWWATGAPGNGACTQGTPCTWGQIVALWPNATIRPSVGGLLVKAGSGWTVPVTVAVDQLTVGVDDGSGNITNRTYDFEPTPQCTTTCYVATTGNDLNGGTSPTDAKRTIQAGVDTVNASGTVVVGAGEFVEDVAVAKAVTIDGNGIDSTVAKGAIGGASAATFSVTAAGVTIRDLTITRDGNTVAQWNDPNLNTAGVSISGSGVATVTASKFTGNRTAIDVNNASGSTITDNLIVDNRTGLIFRNTTDAMTVTGNRIVDNWTMGVLFLDASGGTNTPVQSATGSFAGNDISGNWYGGVVDRQSGGSLPAPGGIVKDFSANWWGTANPVVTTANSAEPGYSALIPVSLGGTATKPASAPDIAGPASANIDFTPRLVVGTDTSPAVGFQGARATLTVTAEGAQAGGTSRLQEGHDLVDAGGVVQVTAGAYPLTASVDVTKTILLRGPNTGISPNDATTPLVANPARVVEATVGSPASAPALRVGATGVSITGFRFTDPGTAGQSNTAIIGGGGNYGGDASGLRVAENVFDGTSRINVYTNGPSTMTGVTVEDNRVTDPTRASGCGAIGTTATSSCGYQLFNLWQTDAVTFADNVVTAPLANRDRVRVLQVAFPNSPSLAAGTGTNITIDGNTIRNSCTFTCFSLAQRVDRVTITDNDIDVDAGNIVQFRQELPSGTVRIERNSLVARGGAAVIFDPVVPAGPSNLSAVTITRNAITAGGIANQRADATVTAPCNWWGQTGGPTGSQNTGLVDVPLSLMSADLAQACPPPSPPPPLTPPDFNPVGPARVFDTRGESPNALRIVPLAKIGGANELEVKIADLTGLVPSSGVEAVALTVTAVDPDRAGFVTAYPCGTRPFVSNVNYAPGERVANAVVVPLSPTGTVCFYSLAPTHLVVDVNGWFTDNPNTNAVGPARVFDTRPDQSPNALRAVPKRRLAANEVLEVQLTDLPGLVPATGVGAVALNLTVDDSTAAGYISVYPCGQRPFVSNVNFQTGERQANSVIVPVSPTGTVCFYSLVPTHLVVDVNAWFAPTGGTVPVGPARLFDTRGPTESPNSLRSVPEVQIGGTLELEVKVTDLPGLVPATGVSSVSLSVTVDDPSAAGYLTVYPCGSRPFASNLNYVADQFTSNNVVVPVSSRGTVCFFSLVATDLVVDINAWFKA